MLSFIAEVDFHPLKTLCWGESRSERERREGRSTLLSLRGPVASRGAVWITSTHRPQRVTSVLVEGVHALKYPSRDNEFNAY